MNRSINRIETTRVTSAFLGYFGFPALIVNGYLFFNDGNTLTRKKCFLYFATKLVKTLPKNYLLEFIQRLGLEAEQSVFFRNSKGKYSNSPNLGKEVQDKIDIIRPDAFYIFNLKPFILFFDLTTERTISREEEIHKQVWSFDTSPLVFIIKAQDISIYNAFHYEKERNRLRKIEIDNSHAIEVFSFWKLQSGDSWKWLQLNEYRKYSDGINRKRVNQKLFDNIKEIRMELENSQISTLDANVIILRLIFIRYLIDRGVNLPKTFISGDNVFENRKSLSLLVSKPKELSEFFEYLNERFNGILFKNQRVSKLNEQHASFLSKIFDSRQDTINPVLFDDFYFDVFDFSIIPVEVISGIYESVIDDETRDLDSAIYTPPFLVEYILSNTIDEFFKKTGRYEAKVLDPSCGSGIFLVQSYRRLVDEEVRRTGQKLESKRLREIAEDNLYGIDINEQALLVAAFSIYIALLDYKEPKTLNAFKFPNLIGKNLFVGNFFDEKHEYNAVLQKVDFDFVLGNPPWKSKKDDKLHTSYIEKNDLTIGRFELAQTFLLRTKSFMSKNTKSALIVTSTIFYNVSTTTKNFKNKFLTTFCVNKFLDLSPVRRLIFEEKDSPASVVFYEVSNDARHLSNKIEHISVKSNILLKYFRILVIEKTDQKSILQKHFIDNDWMFKVAMYGTVLDFNFISRLTSRDKKLKSLIDNKDRIYKGDGIYKGSPKGDFNFLLNRQVIESKEIAPYYTPITKDLRRLTKDDIFLESGRKECLFKGEHILLKHRTKDESEIVVSYCDKSIVFRHGTYGLTTSKEKEKLKLIYGYIITELFTYFQFLTSSAWGIATRPEVKLDEHLNFPFIELDEKNQTKFLIKVNEFIDSFKNESKEFLKSESFFFPAKLFRSINNIIERAYCENEYERDLIDYALKVSRFQFQESRQEKVLKKVNSDQDFLTKYVEVFLSEFQNIYPSEKVRVEIYPLQHFIAINFKFVSNDSNTGSQIEVVNSLSDEKKVLLAISQRLTIWDLTNNTDKNLYVQKDIKGFERDSFYIIKPNELKSWHRAIAWIDVAEVKDLIEKAELEILNE